MAQGTRGSKKCFFSAWEEKGVFLAVFSSFVAEHGNNSASPLQYITLTED